MDRERSAKNLIDDPVDQVGRMGHSADAGTDWRLDIEIALHHRCKHAHGDAGNEGHIITELEFETLYPGPERIPDAF